MQHKEQKQTSGAGLGPGLGLDSGNKIQRVRGSLFAW